MLTAQPCRHCGHDTYLGDRVCAICADPPHGTSGRFTCCGGLYPEHLDPCQIGDAITTARRAIAVADARGSAA